MSDPKPRGDAVLKNLPDALQEELWQKLRRQTLTKVRTWLLETHELVSSETTLSHFFSWYPRSLTLRNAARSSSNLQGTLEKLSELKITAAQAAAIAQVEFELLAAEDRDPALFASLRKGEREAERLRLEREKFEHEKKSDAEKGLEALHVIIKGDAVASQLYAQLRARVKHLEAGGS